MPFVARHSVRPSHPTSTSVTTRTPLLPRRDARIKRMIYDFRKEKYFCKKDWTPDSALNRRTNFDFSRTRFCMPKAGFKAASRRVSCHFSRGRPQVDRPRTRSLTLVTLRHLSSYCAQLSSLGESDEKPFRPTNVAEPIRVFVLDYFAYELRAARAPSGAVSSNGSGVSHG
jgi:hypothetical protein